MKIIRHNIDVQNNKIMPKVRSRAKSTNLSCLESPVHAQLNNEWINDEKKVSVEELHS